MHLGPALLAYDVGQYISIWKPLVLLAMILIWVRLLTWADKDAERVTLPREALNAGFMIGLLVAIFLCAYMPMFLAGVGVLVGVFGAEVGTYLVLRNKKVGLKDLGDEIRNGMRALIGRKDKVVKVQAGQVGLVRQGAIIAPPDSDSPDLLGYQSTQKILTDPLLKGASSIRASAGQGTAPMQFIADGYPFDAPGMSREELAAAALYLKWAVGLDINERRKPQSGMIKASYGGKKMELRVTTKGTTAGESIVVDVDPKSRYAMTLDKMGLTKDQFAEVDTSVKESAGLVICSTPPENGLTNLLYAVVRAHDAFLQHIQTVEHAPESELEGIRQNKLPATPQPGEESKLVGWVVSQEPDVLMVDKIEEPKSAVLLANFAEENRRVYVGMRATSAFDALVSWVRLSGNSKDSLANTRLIINGRLLRTLCTACKQEYSPDPETLRKLNMSPDRVGTLFQARTTPLRDPKGHPLVCEFCHDLHFKGRIGVFELLEVDDEVRQIMSAGKPEESVNRLKMIFKKQKRKYVQEQAVALAIAGETSLHEVARILRSGSTSFGSKKPAPTSGRAPVREPQ